MSRYANIQDSQRPFIKRVAGPFFLLFVTFYLGFHAVSGERGVFALFKENRKLETLKTQLAQVRSERDAMDHKVRLLSDSSLDLDMLDEQVRRVLGMADKSEIVYFPEEKAR